MNEQRMIPPAWNYNPSSKQNRMPLIIMAFLGFCIAMYLTFYQIHLIKNVWDPFFGDGTEKVLTSTLAKKISIPDALLGALAYLTDLITGSIGGADRWRTKPWAVLVFGIAVGPIGLFSVFLVISQPLIVGHWCTLCLCSAFISVVIISPAIDESLASLQYLQRVKNRKRSVWKAFWGDKEIEQTII